MNIFKEYFKANTGAFVWWIQVLFWEKKKSLKKQGENTQFKRQQMLSWWWCIKKTLNSYFLMKTQLFFKSFSKHHKRGRSSWNSIDKDFLTRFFFTQKKNRLKYLILIKSSFLESKNKAESSFESRTYKIFWMKKFLMKILKEYFEIIKKN